MSGRPEDLFRAQSSLGAWAALAHREEQLRRAERARLAGQIRERPPHRFRRLVARLLERRLPAAESPPFPEIRIRVAAATDRVELLYLALRSGTEVVVPGPLLVAEAGGRLRAAASLSSTAVLVEDSADAWEALALLQLRAQQLRSTTQNGASSRPREWPGRVDGTENGAADQRCPDA